MQSTFDGILDGTVDGMADGTVDGTVDGMADGTRPEISDKASISDPSQSQPAAPRDSDSGNSPDSAGCPFRRLEGVDGDTARGSTNRLSGPLGGLAQSLGLDVFGQSLLSRRAALEMKYASLLLCIVAIFEFGAWTLLFNCILQSELLAFNGTTLLAILPASLFAAAVLIYERQFLTTDLRASADRGRFRLAVPVAMRLAIILASALITAQPVELLIFKAQIQSREHEEGIRREVVTRRQELLQAQEIEATRQTELRSLQTGDLLLRSDRRIEQDEQRLREERDRGPEIGQRLESAQGSVNYWDGEMRRRQADLDQLRANPPADLGDASAREAALVASVKEARNNRSAWIGRRDQARVDQGIQEQRVADLRGDIESRQQTATEERRSFALEGAEERQSAMSSKDRLFEWIRQLRSSPPARGRPILEPLSPGAQGPTAADLQNRFVYLPPSYDFFEKLRVLDDLRRGYAARWPGLDSAESQELATLYGLQDVRPCVSQAVQGGPSPDLDPACDPELWTRFQHQRAQLNRSYWMVFGIALVIPLLVIATKLLMTGELAAYYSSAYQAVAGQRDAVALKRSGLQVRAEEDTYRVY